MLSDLVVKNRSYRRFDESVEIDKETSWVVSTWRDCLLRGPTHNPSSTFFRTIARRTPRSSQRSVGLDTCKIGQGPPRENARPPTSSFSWTSN